MKYRVGIREFGNSQIKGVKYELVIVITAQGVRDDTFILKVEDRTQIQLCIIAILKFCDICQPLFVKLFSRKITVQNVLRCNFRRRTLVLRTFPADDRF